MAPPVDATEVVSIEAAFKGLYPEAFSLWIRLMTVPGRDLALGRSHLAHLIGLPDRTFNRRLRWLLYAGYIRLVKPTRIGEPTKIVILKRAAIIGVTRFAILTTGQR